MSDGPADDAASMGFYVIRPCRGATGFAAMPRKGLTLDLGESAERLRTAGYKVVDAGVMLIVEKEIELTVYRSGKILARTDDEDRARTAIESAYSLLL